MALSILTCIAMDLVSSGLALTTIAITAAAITVA